MAADIPLYNFAYHQVPDWLDQVAEVAKSEYWGSGKKVLDLYLRANFEIAKLSNQVYEDLEKKTTTAKLTG